MPKALPKFLVRKLNIAVLFQVLRQHVFSVVTKEMFKPGGLVFEHILRHMNHVQTCVEQHVLPLINDDSISAAAAWTRVSMICRVNYEIALLTKGTDDKARLEWNAHPFLYQLKQNIANKPRLARAFVGLTDDQRTQLAVSTSTETPTPAATDTDTIAKLQQGLSASSVATMSTPTKSTSKVTCHQCGEQGHKAIKCPKLSPAIRKVLKSRNTNKGAAPRGRGRGRGRFMKQMQPMQYAPMSVPAYMQSPAHQGIVRPSLVQNPYMQPYVHQGQMPLQQHRAPRRPNQQQHQPQPHRHGQHTQWQAQQPANKRQRGNTPGAKYYAQTPQGLQMLPQYINTSVCHHFEGQRCKFMATPLECRHPHFCRSCKATDHCIWQCSSRNGPITM